MSTAAEVADFGETDQLSATESAVHDDAGNGDVADVSADANGNRNPVRHRVLKTVCLYVSFVTMVRASAGTFLQAYYETCNCWLAYLAETQAGVIVTSESSSGALCIEVGRLESQTSNDLVQFQ